MILSDDKKKRATIIISRMSSSPDKIEDVKRNEIGDEVDDSIGYQSACEEIISAVKSNDHMALKDALKSFLDMYNSDDKESHNKEEQEDYEKNK